MVRLQYTARAVKDLNNIYSFIGQDSVLYARAFTTALRKRASALKKYPELGRPFQKDKYEDLRQVIYKAYRIIYHFAGTDVTIITIHHQTRLPDNIIELQDFKK